MTNKKTKKKSNPVGRPLKFKTAKELDARIDDYINNCPDTRQILIKDSEGATQLVDVPCLTITGLALYLGFCDRQSMYDYENKSQFSYSIKRARAFIELNYEKMLANSQCTGAIFALKNFGWRDKAPDETSENINLAVAKLLSESLKSD
jgi:hypothetical protein